MIIPAGLLITNRSLSSYIISNLNLKGLRDAISGSGILRFIVSPIETFFDGLLIIALFSVNFSFKIK